MEIIPDKSSGKPYSLRLTQTSKGLWYIDKLQCDGDCMNTVIREVEQAAKDSIDMVRRINDKQLGADWGKTPSQSRPTKE